jgi:hypothetical protein
LLLPGIASIILFCLPDLSVEENTTNKQGQTSV